MGVITGGGGGGAEGFTTGLGLPEDGGCGARGFGELLPLPGGLGGTTGLGLPRVPVPLMGVPMAILAGTAGLSVVAGTGGK